MAAARRTDGIMLAVSVLVPSGLAVARVRNVPDAVFDGALLRVLGLDPQVWRGLDAATGVLLGAIPIGTRAARAGLGSALVAGVAGAILYLVVRALLEACAQTQRLGSFVAALAALLPVVAGPWQSESSSVGGSATGAVLALLPLCLMAAPAEGRAAPWRAVVFAVGLALGYEPLVGACALAGAATLAGAGEAYRRSLALAWRAGAGALGAAFAAGLAPLLLALARVRAAGLPLVAAMAAGWAGEGGGSRDGSVLSRASAEIGPAVLLLAAGGLVLGLIVARARPLTLALVVLALAGVASGWARAPSGPVRYSGPLLAAFAATCALAGAGMQALVRLVANAKVPFARATAAMVLMLELVLPVDAADDGLSRARGGAATAIWDDVAWGELPPGAVLLLASRPACARALAARARGALRDDVVIVPGFSPGPLDRRTLAGDPALLPLWRDLEIDGVPSEASLAVLASARPLAMTYEPRWGRTLGLHLVPDGLLDRFETEPRGASDRRAGLAAFAPRRARLARLVHDDPVLAAVTAEMLRARATLFAAVDARDAATVARALDDVRAFTP